MKIVALMVMSLTAVVAMAGEVDVYSPQDLEGRTQKLSQKRSQFSSENLKRYGNHYTMLAHREATGSSEVHEKEADIFVAVEGNASIVTGGELVNPHREKPGELRGTSVRGGEKHELAQGSVIHIPAGTPHQVLIQEGKPFTYFVVKVIE